MIWVDAQLSPNLAEWISITFGLECKAIRDIGLRDADDETIFLEAKKADAIIITKDSDFRNLQIRLLTPPKIIWITCGNTSNEKLKIILSKHLLVAIELLHQENIVEITG